MRLCVDAAIAFSEAYPNETPGHSIAKKELEKFKADALEMHRGLLVKFTTSLKQLDDAKYPITEDCQAIAWRTCPTRPPRS